MSKLPVGSKHSGLEKPVTDQDEDRPSDLDEGTHDVTSDAPSLRPVTAHSPGRALARSDESSNLRRERHSPRTRERLPKAGEDREVSVKRDLLHLGKWHGRQNP